MKKSLGGFRPEPRYRSNPHASHPCCRGGAFICTINLNLSGGSAEKTLNFCTRRQQQQQRQTDQSIHPINKVFLFLPRNYGISIIRLGTQAWCQRQERLPSETISLDVDLNADIITQYMYVMHILLTFTLELFYNMILYTPCHIYIYHLHLFLLPPCLSEIISIRF